MFYEIFSFELKNRFKKPNVYIFFTVFFAFSFLIGCVRGGAFDEIAASFGKVFVNTVLSISSTTNIFNNSIIGLIILTAVMSPAIYQDFKFNMHSLLFTKPITKTQYFGGRFLAAYVTALFVLSGSYFGYMFTEFMPFVDADRYTDFNLMMYVQPFFLFVIPNTLFLGGILFAVVTLSRNMLTGYVVCIVITILIQVANYLLSDLDNRDLVALLDPLGNKAMNEVTRYWTISEKNNNLIPLNGVLLLNRLLWLGLGIGVFSFTFIKFQFSQFASEPVLKKKSIKKTKTTIVSASIGKVNLPTVSQNFSFNYYFSQLFFETKIEFTGIIKSVPFLIISLIGMLAIFSSAPQMGKIYDTATLPVTYNVLNTATGVFGLFMMIIIVFYSGNLIWKERDAKLNELADALPTPSWLPITSKLCALISVQFVLLTLIFISGIVIQTINGYYNYEPILYIKELYGFQFINFTLITILAVFIQIAVNNKNLAYFITILILLIIPIIFSAIEWNDNLYQFNSSGARRIYSDMNNYGHFVLSFSWFKVYWLAFAILLFLLSSMLWVRGKETNLIKRFKIGKVNLPASKKIAFAFSFTIFILSGGFIYYNTHVLNKYTTPNDQILQQVAFEKKYKKLEEKPQPRITDVKIEVDIYPNKRNIEFKGYYILKNKTNQPINEIYVLMNNNVDVTKLDFDQPFEMIKDKEMDFYTYILKTPLKAGEIIQLNMDLKTHNRGFENASTNTNIVYDGTFINNKGYLPSIGYNSQYEIDNPNQRKKYNLPPKERVARINDEKAKANTYIANDADWINFEATLSTIPSQIAIAPGYLQKEWEKDGRRYFHYKMDQPILNFYSFLSAEYEVEKDVWKNSNGKEVNLEVYYHKGHHYNVKTMLKGVKKALSYYSANFSPYQHKQVRILEFPKYATFAQSFPNTIPFSEGIGFIADVDTTNEEIIDYPFYVTAHEVAHQWWAHQVIGANVQGATVMSETMSQYSALMVMKKEYGEKKMKKFLKQEMDSYLRGRANENRKELPLYLCENQQYIHYNKGSVVMYALQDYIGEDSVNIAMKRYIKKVGFQDAPYTNSIEFLSYIKAVTPDSLQYLISDMFEKITVYDNKVDTLFYTETSEGKYDVTLRLDCKKLYSDSIGNETEAPLNDWIDIGVFAQIKNEKGRKHTEEIYLQKRKIDKEKMEFHLVVDHEPIKAGIDPYYKLIDRKPKNNMRKFGESSSDLFGEKISIQIGG